jgi:acyl-coenzyme A synthetase/AMP-(fatty) acid ligase
LVPSPDPLRLSVPKAFVTLCPGIEASEEVRGRFSRSARKGWHHTSASGASSS